MRLKKDNVEREVPTKEAAEKLMKEGFEEVTVKIKKLELGGLKVNDLRNLAKEKGVEGYASMKKEELLKALEVPGKESFEKEAEEKSEEE